MDKRLGNKGSIHVISIIEAFLFVLVAGASLTQAAQSIQMAGAFELKVSNGYLSLKADQAPLAQIFREIARQAGITIDSNIGPEEKITTRLDRVPLEDAIRQLAKNVSVYYVQDAKTNTRRIERVVVLSQQKEGASGQPKKSPEAGKPGERAPEPATVKKPSPQPEPFKFEFDPAKSAEKEKARKQP